jgi:two-component system LytT family response regulator
MKLIIIDDESHAREALSLMVELYYPEASVTATFAGIQKAVETIRNTKPDVLLLDMEIGEERGSDILKYFPRPTFKVIFITAYQHYALEAFRCAALDYLLKPVDPDLLVSALDKAADLTGLENLAGKIDIFLSNTSGSDKNTKRLALKTADDIHIVNIRDIMYCEADHSYTIFHLADDTRIMVSNTLGDYEDMLNSFGFVRIHKSYLLNMDYLSRYEKADGGNAILKNNTSLPVSIRKRDQFIQSLSRL